MNSRSNASNYASSFNKHKLMSKKSMPQLYQKQLSNTISMKSSERSKLSQSLIGSMHEKAKPVFREVTYSEMMQLYQPKWLAVVGSIASVFASLQLPLFGFVLSQYIFLLALPVQT